MHLLDPHITEMKLLSQTIFNTTYEAHSRHKNIHYKESFCPWESVESLKSMIVKKYGDLMLNADKVEPKTIRCQANIAGLDQARKLYWAQEFCVM